MSVLVKGLAMDFIRQERNEMAITGIWPASVRTIGLSPTRMYTSGPISSNPYLI